MLGHKFLLSSINSVHHKNYYGHCDQWKGSSRGSVVKMTDLHPANLGSVPADTHESLAAGRASGQNCSSAPVKVPLW